MGVRSGSSRIRFSGALVFSRGAEEKRAHFSGSLSGSKAPLCRVMSDAPCGQVARTLATPVICEPTRVLTQNLLTRRTVLVQRDLRGERKDEDRCGAQDEDGNAPKKSGWVATSLTFQLADHSEVALSFCSHPEGES